MGAQTLFTQKLEKRIIYTEKPLNILCTTKHAQSTSQCYFVLQSLHKARPSTTLYNKACTKHLPALLCTTDKACTKYSSVLLCTTKFAQSTSQYYFVLLTKLAQSTPQYHFVLQSLHKARPSTTLYYKACTKHIPVLLCTTKLARSTCHYYFVLQSLHEVLPSTTLY